MSLLHVSWHICYTSLLHVSEVEPDTLEGWLVPASALYLQGQQMERPGRCSLMVNLSCEDLGSQRIILGLSSLS